MLELFGFPEGAHNRGLPSNPTIYTTSPSLCEDQPLVWLASGSLHLPHDLSSMPHYCAISTFHHLLQFVLKTECCHCFSRESQVEIVFFFFHLIYVEPKHQINERKQASVNNF